MVPSRARSNVLDGSTLGVFEQLAVDGLGDPALETSDGLERPFALGSFASVVGAAIGVETDLTDRSDVDHVVHPPIAGS